MSGSVHQLKTPLSELKFRGLRGKAGSFRWSRAHSGWWLDGITWRLFVGKGWFTTATVEVNYDCTRTQAAEALRDARRSVGPTRSVRIRQEVP